MKKIALTISVALVLAGCSAIKPNPLQQMDISAANRADNAAMRKDVEPLRGPLTLNEAMARALKYNLDRRSKMMEESLALNQLDVTRFDMLPRLLASAGYTSCDNDRISLSTNSDTGALSPGHYVSQERTHHTLGLDASWSVLDYGLAQANSTQAADRVLMAGERRRKAMHLLLQDVRIAYWRAACAQQLRDSVAATMAMAEGALKDARTSEAERVRNPLDALRYQRQLLENLRLLEAIDQELSTAQVELASLINAPLGQSIQIADESVTVAADRVLDLPVQRLEEEALLQNPDLRERHYDARIAREETRKVMARLYPNVSFNYGVHYDSDRYQVNTHWRDAGLQVSFNLLNLATGPTQLRLAEAGIALADQRRMATQLAILTQVHLARLQLQNARSQFVRADAIYSADQKIAEHVRNRTSAQATSQLDRVSNDTAASLSLLRRYQALAQVQAAESRLLASVGLEPRLGSTDTISLQDLTRQLAGQADPWAVLRTPAPVKPAVAAPDTASKGQW